MTVGGFKGHPFDDGYLAAVAPITEVRLECGTNYGVMTLHSLSVQHRTMTVKHALRAFSEPIVLVLSEGEYIAEVWSGTSFPPNLSIPLVSGLKLITSTGQWTAVRLPVCLPDCICVCMTRLFSGACSCVAVVCVCLSVCLSVRLHLW